MNRGVVSRSIAVLMFWLSASMVVAEPNDVACEQHTKVGLHDLQYLESLAATSTDNADYQSALRLTREYQKGDAFKALNSIEKTYFFKILSYYEWANGNRSAEIDALKHSINAFPVVDWDAKLKRIIELLEVSIAHGNQDAVTDWIIDNHLYTIEFNYQIWQMASLLIESGGVPQIKKIFEAAIAAGMSTYERDRVFAWTYRVFQRDGQAGDMNILEDLYQRAGGTRSLSDVFAWSRTQHPVKLNSAKAIYPLVALDQKVSGCALIAFDINEKGIPINIRAIASQGSNAFAGAGITATSKMRFRPIKDVEGKPLGITGWVRPFKFIIKGD